MRSNHVTAAALLALATGASAQNHVPLFSAGWHGPTMGVPDSGFGQPITEGDLLGATPKPGPGPLPAPTLFYAGGPGVVPNHLNLGWYPSAVGHGPGAMGFVEVDAFSLGLDPELTDDQVLQPDQLFFSVDEFALGVSTGGGPELATETPVGESSADAFANLSTIFLPSPVVQGSHVGVLDGDGVAGPSAFAYPGLGLVEPNSPQGAPPDGGDDLDALELQHEDWNALFFSLDSLYTDPHPLMGGTTNSGSAFAHGFLGGDVLMTLPGGNGPQLFAPANQLGHGVEQLAGDGLGGRPERPGRVCRVGRCSTATATTSRTRSTSRWGARPTRTATACPTSARGSVPRSASAPRARRAATPTPPRAAPTPPGPARCSPAAAGPA